MTWSGNRLLASSRCPIRKVLAEMLLRADENRPGGKSELFARLPKIPVGDDVYRQGI
jgi:hypothetical protein